MSADAAEELKAKGNAAFAMKKYGEARDLFSRAIAAAGLGHASLHVLYGNRAACLFNSEDYAGAQRDALAAIEARPDWPRGHERLAYACRAMGDLEGAAKAAKRWLDLQPDSTDAARFLKDCQPAAAAAAAAAGSSHMSQFDAEAKGQMLRLTVVLNSFKVTWSPTKTATFLEQHYSAFFGLQTPTKPMPDPGDGYLAMLCCTLGEAEQQVDDHDSAMLWYTRALEIFHRNPRARRADVERRGEVSITVNLSKIEGSLYLDAATAVGKYCLRDNGAVRALPAASARVLQLTVDDTSRRATVRFACAYALACSIQFEGATEALRDKATLEEMIMIESTDHPRFQERLRLNRLVVQLEKASKKDCPDRVDTIHELAKEIKAWLQQIDTFIEAGAPRIVFSTQP